MTVMNADMLGTRGGVRRRSRVQAIAWSALLLMLALAVLACLPAFHVFLGVDSVDAFDQGVVRPENDGAGYAASVLVTLWLSAGLFGLTFAKLRRDVRYQETRFSRTRAHTAPVRMRIAHARSTLAARSAGSDDETAIHHFQSMTLRPFVSRGCASGGLFDVPHTAHGYIREVSCGRRARSADRGGVPAGSRMSRTRRDGAR